MTSEQPLTNFESIRQETPEGVEYWSARDLMPLWAIKVAGKILRQLSKRPKLAANNPAKLCRIILMTPLR